MSRTETIPVLDKGFVRLVDHYGSDARIVQAARVSYGAGTKTVNDDRALIDYLMRHQHMTPFEMPDFTFHIKCPIFIARQWMRHRTGSFNEISARYSEIKDEFYVPELERLTKQSSVNKQGSSQESVSMPVEMRRAMYEQIDEAYVTYVHLLNMEVARETARGVLSQSMYTEFYWKVNARNLMHFLRLRGPEDGHAQAEIQEYAKALQIIFREALPWTWDAFEEHVLYAKTFSRTEWAAIQSALDTNVEADSSDDVVNFVVTIAQELGLSGRKLEEFKRKLE